MLCLELREEEKLASALAVCLKGSKLTADRTGCDILRRVS